MDQLRAKSDPSDLRIQGRTSGQMKLRTKRAQEAIYILVARAKATDDPIYLKSRVCLSDNLCKSKKKALELKKSLIMLKHV